MVVRCEDVWREVSNYLDNEVEPELRAAIEEHVRGCKRCTAVVDGTRNVIQIYGDERMVEVPLGFSRRLHRRLEGNVASARRSFLGWLVAAAATVLVAGAFEVAKSSVFRRPGLRSEHARASDHVPPDMMVVVAEDGKTFHVAGCPFIHDKSHLRTITAREAEQQGYAPCIRCMKKYLDPGALARSDDPADDLAGFEDPARKSE
jgi:Putative zinc-finger